MIESVSFIPDSIKYLPVDSNTQSYLYSVRYYSSLDHYPPDHRQTNNMKDNNKFIKSV